MSLDVIAICEYMLRGRLIISSKRHESQDTSSLVAPLNSKIQNLPREKGEEDGRATKGKGGAKEENGRYSAGYIRKCHSHSRPRARIVIQRGQPRNELASE